MSNTPSIPLSGSATVCFSLVLTVLILLHKCKENSYKILDTSSFHIFVVYTAIRKWFFIEYTRL